LPKRSGGKSFWGAPLTRKGEPISEGTHTPKKKSHIQFRVDIIRIGTVAGKEKGKASVRRPRGNTSEAE